MNKILLVQQNWLGDVLFTTPAMRAIRKRYPAAHIACLVPARVREALKNNPNINEVILYDDRASVFSPGLWKTVLNLRSRHFEVAIFFHNSKTKACIAQWAGIPQRWGYGAGREKLMTKSVAEPSAPLHKIDYFLHLIDALGFSADGRYMDFNPSEAESLKLTGLLKTFGVSTDEPYAVVHAGGNWGLKRWPTDYFCQWIYFFLEAGYGKVILCGSASEQWIALKIAKRFSPDKVISLSGKTSLDMLALLLKNARLVLSNDSGPIHLAASQRTPIVGLFGPTSAALTGPVSAGPMKILQKDVGCRVPCYYRACSYRVCMDFLQPNEVFLATQNLLGVA